MTQERLISCLGAAARAFTRDLKDRHFVTIAAAIVLAVAATSAVNMFTERVRAALALESTALLAADLALVSNDPIEARIVAEAGALNLRTAPTFATRSVVTFTDRLQLSELKAVGENYPLRGELIVSDSEFGASYPHRGAPPPGVVWVERRLLTLLGAALGDDIGIGARRFTAAKVLIVEPDRAGDLFNIAPRVMMNSADIPATGLIQPASRVRYGLLLAGAPQALAKFRAFVANDSDVRVLSPDDARPEIRTALERAEQYFGLASFTTIVLAGIAIALAAGSFKTEQQDTVALLRTLGASRNYIFTYFAVEILLLGGLAAILGAVLGASAQAIIAQSMSGLSQAALPPPSASAALKPAALAIMALSGFALPPLLALRDVPPLRVLRRDQEARRPRATSVVIYALISSAFVAPWGRGDLELTLWSLAGLIAGAGGLCLVALLMIKIVEKLSVASGALWRVGVVNIARRGRFTALQIAAVGLGITAMLVLGIVRDDLLETWVNSLPADAPNQFLINIQPQDVDALSAFFTARKMAAPWFYPMIRGRLRAINNREITPDSYADPRTRRLVEREFNLSSAATMKPYNRLVAGRWWREGDDPAQFSVEAGVAATLGITLGDTLRYQIADREIRGTVRNLRAVQWDSMQVNFFVEAPPALLEDFPGTYITSFRLEPSDLSLLSELVAAFPSVTVIDVAILVQQVRNIMDRAARTIEFVFLFTLAAGLLVLIAAIQATQTERIFESTLLKTLGAGRALTLRTMAIEFLLIGGVAGVIAGALALLIARLLAQEVLRIDYSYDPWVIVSGLCVGLACVCGIGIWAIYRALRQPASTILNQRH